MDPHADAHVVHPHRLHPEHSAMRARLRTGVSVDTSEWGTAYSERRQRIRAFAVAATARREGFAFSHLTAGALHRLPFWGVDATRVHTIPFSQQPPKSHLDVVRHKIPLRASDVTIVDGLWTTSLDRTLFDLARSLPFDAALAAVCAGLRQAVSFDNRRQASASSTDILRHVVVARMDAAHGSRGIRTARQVMELADPRVESSGEARSLACMWNLRMPMPKLQVPIETAHGVFFPDFAWPEIGRFGEFDGEIKIRDASMRNGRTPEEVIAHQNWRRRAIEDATGWRGMSWGWSDCDEPSALWRTLVDQGWRPHWRV